MTAVRSAADVESHDHTVNFYGADHELVHAVADYVADGLRGGEVVIVIADGDHRRAIEEQVAADGVDVLDQVRRQRFVCLDAAVTLSRFMADGQPDAARFHAEVGALVAEAARTGRPVRAFGEMVAILWAEGNVQGAIELEGLWNALLRQHRFLLYCAYPMAAVAAADDLVAVGRVCALHTGLIPPGELAPPVSAVVDPETRSQLYVPSTRTIRAVRHFVAGTLREWGREHSIPDAMIVVSELATNAVRHANSPFRVVLERRSHSVRISVQDTSPAAAVQRSARPTEPGGRGMAIVDHLSDQWGTERAEVGKVVWSELADKPA